MIDTVTTSDNEKLSYNYVYKNNVKNNSIPILLLHDINDTHESFNLIRDELMSNYNIIHFDYRLLDTKELVSNSSIDIYTQDIISIFDNLGISNANIISHGSAAHIAYELSINYSDYVNAIILEDFITIKTIDKAIFLKKISNIKHPTLLLKGSKSKLISANDNQAVVMSNDFFKSASVELVESNGHIHNPKVFLSQVNKFLSIF
jgi:pimeloyl-ACP methyl ester carboxylesterase